MHVSLMLPFLHCMPKINVVGGETFWLKRKVNVSRNKFLDTSWPCCFL